MDHSDQNAIDELFDKLDQVEGRSAPRDAEAEAYIAEKLTTQSAAPYFMAQTIIVQEQALVAAQQRIEDLEAQLAESRSGGFLGGLFGGQPRPAASRGRTDAVPYAPGGGNGFLAGAGQTALGVAGGILIANVVAGAFAGGSAQAAEVPESGGDFGSDDESGGFDMGGGGDFDFGGDF